jgi:anthranilate synthase component 1
VTLRPSQDEFESLASRGNLIPVVREISADMDTPLSLFRRLDDGRTAFLLESVEGGEKWARYSFMGVGARAMFRARGQEVAWTEGGETRRFRVEGDPLRLLRERLSRYRPVSPEGVELPRFSGGAVGMVSWDWVRFVERIPDENPDELGYPDLYFVFPETVVVYDNVRHSAMVIREIAIGEQDDAARLYRQVKDALEATVRRLREPLPPEPRRRSVSRPMEVRPSITREGYEQMVKRAKEYIRAGDIFQVVLSQRFRISLQVDPFQIYRQLRRINPSPYLIFLRCEGTAIIGSSPEILVRVENRQIDLRPIAGTRPRGKTPEEDRALEEELLADPKELAEHVMLVDLGRNDVGRVARYGTVEVSDVMVIERYSHVMHITSNVTGLLCDGKDAFDALRACLPAGTVSGAPKVRAMEIIDELEPHRRGPYAGAVGYIDYSGNMDTCIALRTIVIQDNIAYVQAGAGIVADSVPLREYQETLNKARGLLKAIEITERRDAAENAAVGVQASGIEPADPSESEERGV